MNANKKRSNLISFKLSEETLDKLEAIRKDEDSLSLVAKRLVEEMVGVTKPKTTLEDKVDEVLDLLRGKRQAA